MICLNEPLPQITYVHSANPFVWSKPEAKILMKSHFMSSKWLLAFSMNCVRQYHPCFPSCSQCLLEGSVAIPSARQSEALVNFGGVTSWNFLLKNVPCIFNWVKVQRRTWPQASTYFELFLFPGTSTGLPFGFHEVKHYHIIRYYHPTLCVLNLTYHPSWLNMSENIQCANQYNCSQHLSYACSSLSVHQICHVRKCATIV